MSQTMDRLNRSQGVGAANLGTAAQQHSGEGAGKMVNIRSLLNSRGNNNKIKKPNPQLNAMVNDQIMLNTLNQFSYALIGGNANENNDETRQENSKDLHYHYVPRSKTPDETNEHHL